MHFDLAVIGSGPAGQKGAVNAAKLGKHVALIERAGRLGGHCVTTGTIPSKALREAILQVTGHRERRSGRAGPPPELAMDELRRRTQRVVQSEIEIVAAQMERNGIRCIRGEAAFVDPHRLAIRAESGIVELTADHVLIATGSRPYHPPDVPFAAGKIMDSDQLLELPELPRSLLVVGGGVIGVEYACMFAAVGARVTLLDRRPELLEFLDREIVAALVAHLHDARVAVRLGVDLAGVRCTGEQVVAVLKSGEVCVADAAVMAAGREANTAGLNLEAAGLMADARGRLRVNEYFQTDVAHIFAAGDVIGFPALAATSMEQGRLATSFMFGRLDEAGVRLFPYGIYTIPEISTVGQTEAELRAAGTPFAVGMARYREIARGQLIGDTHGLLKLLFHPASRRLLGVHIIGEGATELIHIGQAVMAGQMPIDYFVANVFNYPTLAECYRVAALDGVNRVRAADCSLATG